MASKAPSSPDQGFDFHRLKARWQRDRRAAAERSTQLLERVRGQAGPILRAHNADCAILFGSIAGGRARAGSDIDLLVFGTRPTDYWALRGALESAFGRPVDLLTEPDDPAVIKHAQATGIVIYASESSAPARIDRR